MMTMKNDRLLKAISEERIERLFNLAKDRTMHSASDRLSKRYIGIAESIISHYKVRPGVHMKREVCKRCKSILIPGMNCSIRIASGRGYRVILCGCGEEKHIFYKKGDMER